MTKYQWKVMKLYVTHQDKDVGTTVCSIRKFDTINDAYNNFIENSDQYKQRAFESSIKKIVIEIERIIENEK